MESLIEALKADKKSIIYFYNNACGHCKQLHPKIKIMESTNPENFFQYNTHENTDISNAFKIEYVPTLVVVENKKYKKLEGYKKIKEFYGNGIDTLPNNKGNL